MKWLAQLVAAAAVLTSPLSASAQSLTEAQARTVIAPWYGLFNQPVQGDMKTLQEQSSPRTTSLAGAIFPANAGAAMPRSKWSEALPSPSPT